MKSKKLHSRIIAAVKAYIAETEQSKAAGDFAPSYCNAFRFLDERRREEFEKQAGASDESMYQVALQAKNLDVFRAHLKAKYGDDRPVEQKRQLSACKKEINALHLRQE